MYSSDGKKILSASDDATIKEWDTATGVCIQTLEGHDNVVDSAVYSNDGKKILSASSDHTIKEWDVATGVCVRTLKGHAAFVNSAVYSGDGKKIVSTSGQDIIRVWDTATGVCLETYDEGEPFSIPGYPPNPAKHKLKINGYIIYAPDTAGQGEERWLINVPGLFIHGCPFENLEKGSQWTEEGLNTLKTYSGSGNIDKMED